MRVYIGCDEREIAAVEVCAKSLLAVTHGEIVPELLDARKLYDQGLLWRPVDQRGGQDYDLTSNAFTSTRFKFSRFLVPIICQAGHALFVDCDTVFVEDPRRMLESHLAKHAVGVAAHDEAKYPASAYKMVNQWQDSYPRKNQSSVMLFNCNHPANRRLSLRDVNERRAVDLHNFYWLNVHHELGYLHPRWNWLVDVEPQPEHIGIAHLTLGGPWIKGWQGGSFDNEWKAARDA